MKPKVTMYTIADEVGMSIAAVSRAFDPASCLKPDKRALILETAERLGYVPNRMAARLSSEPIRIGALIWGSLRVYYGHIEEGLREAFRLYKDYKVDLDLRILDRSEASDEDAAEALDGFAASGCAGVIVSGALGPAGTKALARLSAAGIPAGLVGGDIPGTGTLSCFLPGAGLETTAKLPPVILSRCSFSSPAANFRFSSAFGAMTMSASGTPLEARGMALRGMASLTAAQPARRVNRAVNAIRENLGMPILVPRI